MIRLRHWLLAVAILVGLLHPGRAADHSGYFAGRLADGRLVYLALATENKVVNGWLRLEGSAYAVRLAGSASGKLQLLLTNEVPADSVRWIGAVLQGAVAGAPAVFTGRLFAQGQTNGLALSATNIAARQTITRHRGLQVQGRGGGKGFTATWPEFAEKSGFPRLITELLSAEARGEVQQFTAGAYGISWEGLLDGGASWNWEGLLDTHIIWLSGSVASLCQDRYEYTGGAHGGSALVGRNFQFAQGKAREFKLAELFRKESQWFKSLTSLCLRELRRQQAGFVVNGTVKAIEQDDLTGFNVDQRGLLLYFADYAVGSHAEGLYQIFIPWSELRPLLDPAGPARLIPGVLDTGQQK